jgi:hypothetical protein
LDQYEIRNLDKTWMCLNEEILGRDGVYRQSMPRTRGRGGRGKNIINGLKKQEKIKSLVLSFRRQF